MQHVLDAYTGNVNQLRRDMLPRQEVQRRESLRRQARTTGQIQVNDRTTLEALDMLRIEPPAPNGGVQIQQLDE
jgi:hypothetical protein